MKYQLQNSEEWKKHLTIIGFKKGHKTWCEGKAFNVKNNNPNWKGDNISKAGGWARARRWFKKEPCILCGNEKSEAHHMDGNTLNNTFGNVFWLCRKHHMIFDGRMERFKNMSPHHRAK